MERRNQNTNALPVTSGSDAEGTLYACGFNAQGQLDSHSAEDLHAPRPVFTEASYPRAELLFAGWSETVLMCTESLVRTGQAQQSCMSINVRGQYGHRLTQGFGDHNGLSGALDEQGQVYLMDSDSELVVRSNSGTPSIASVALTGNGRVAISLAEQPKAQITRILEFASLSNFEKWCVNACDSLLVKDHSVPGCVSQLIGNATTFTCLTRAGEVYTWGDARHRSLGRFPSGQGSQTADEAGLVDALGGIRIVKISSGGWLVAALSEDGAAYLWGTGTPGKEDAILDLEDLHSSEVALLALTRGDTAGEPMDFLDLAVGGGHVAVLTVEGDVYTAGENTNGQLGLGRKSSFEATWQRVSLESNLVCTGLRSGPKCTFFRTKAH